MPSRLKPLAGPLAVVALTVLAIYGGNKLLFPGGGGYTLTAEFRDAAGLTKNSNVKIGGVAGGSVTDLKLTDRDTALVTMELDDGAFPIGAGARAASRPVNLLGEKYVDLDPGDLRRPVPSGSAIPIARTSRPVELDDVLNTLQPDVRARLRILINEAGIAVGGRGTDLNAVLDQLPSALDQSTELLGAFSADSRRLGDLIERSDRVLAAFAGRRGDLQSLVDAAADTLEVTATRRRELAATVGAAPQALRSLRATMGQLTDTSARLEPFAMQVRRTAPLLARTLEDLPAFAGDAAPALSALRATAPRLEQLGRDARTPVRRLRPTAARLATFARDLAPIVGSFDRHATRNMLGLMDGWSKTIARSDGLGHLFGLRILFDRTLLTTLVDRYVGPNTPGAARPAKAAAAGAARRPSPSAPASATPAPTGRRPSTGIDTVDKALQGVGVVVQRVPSAVTGAVGALTGGRGAGGDAPSASASGSDVGTLLDYLVGP